MMKKTVFMVLMACIMILVGCAQNSGNGNEGVSEKEGTLRVVATNFVAAEHLFALGVPPIGVGGLSTLKSFPVYEPYLSKYEMEDLGQYGSPLNYEKIVELQPDLIISFNWDGAELNKLEPIAETVVVDPARNVRTDFDESLRTVAEAVGAQSAYDEFMEKYESNIKETASLLEEQGMKGKTAVFMMATENGNHVYNGLRTRVYFEELGLAPIPDLQESEGTVDLETLVKYDPEIIFLAEDYTNPNAYAEELQNNDIWKSLTAARNGHVFEVDTSILGPMAIGQNLGVDIIRESLTQ